jgi:hypothetical protein
MKIWIKLVALLTALSATIVAIFWLKQSHINSFWTSLGLGSEARINWCSERVESLYFYDAKVKIYEHEAKWYLKSDSEKELDYLRVEKWFARYCQIAILRSDDKPRDEAKADVEIQFINGERLTIFTFPDSNFRINKLIFKSETLRQGLKELLAFDSNL